jgi:DNA-binding GntR family transcriptional regulator
MGLHKGPTETQLAQCLTRQAFIEHRLGMGVSQRALATELGVARKTLRKAMAHFAMERDQLDDTAAVAA